MVGQPGRLVRAAGDHARTFLLADADVARHLFPVLARDHRAEIRARIGRIADHQVVRAAREFLHEAVVDRALHEDPRAGGAAFAVDREDREQRRVERAIEIGVVENEHRRLAAELHRILLEARAFHDPLAGDRAAGKRHRAHVRMPHERIAGRRAVTLHDVQHAGRDAGFECEPAELVGRQRRQLRHLQHGRVAEREARRRLPRGRHERHVPRRHQRTYADRLVQRVVEHLVVDRIGAAVHLHAHFREEVEVLGRARNQLLARLRDRQAGILRLQRGEHRHVLLDQFAELAHQLCALLGRRVRPFRERFLRGAHGRVDLGLAARRDVGDDFTRRRVQRREAFAALHFAAADPVLDGHVLSFLGRRPQPAR